MFSLDYNMPVPMASVSQIPQVFSYTMAFVIPFLFAYKALNLALLYG